MQFYAFNVRSYTLQSYWEGTMGKVQYFPQENFKAEQVGVVCDHINHFGSHTSIESMGGGGAMLN